MALQTKLKAPNGLDITLPTGLFINNEFVASSSGTKITSVSPADGSEICSVEAASADDVDSAVKAARAAFEHPSWADCAGRERSVLMHKLADLVEQHANVLATIETWDNGKPYSVSFNEDLQEVIYTLRYYAGWADKIHGQTIPTTRAKFAYTLRQPVGVCAQIIPWNYPLAMAAWKLGPALATGNCIVLKPAEQTPLSILYFATLVKEAGFPPGVFNIVNGFGRETGTALVTHPNMASSTLKNITLETGGKSPLVIFEDADLEQAAKWAYIGILSNQGQVCTATSRLIVQDSVLPKFLEFFKTEIKNTAVTGNPFSESTTHGPQVSQVQYDKILSFIEGAKKEGGKVEMGGASAQATAGKGKGFYIEPTVISNVTKDMTIFQEEVFGPVVAVTPFKTEEEALKLANNSQYGLAAAVFSQNIERAHKVAERLEAGMVWINSSNDSDPAVPFGGVKQSGIGRELGEAGLHSYLETKAVHVNLGAKL
ncbi:hypothetical protein LLEC1_04126 [Akanthomyces lecanii]|uniref:aldehyde dehydrogenase (NAD(+)) n=1 Tax=Cordyceps confragosa TaxID=2714763 RepID=A0A179IEY3_CORDF|nr:hypothetical protein LLEC1_04126 [Akanthomyces lecanii]